MPAHAIGNYERMSVREADPTAEGIGQILEARDVALGRYTTVRRFLPARTRRLIGPWCFVDHFGPDDVTAGRGMWVPPHPHTGLQTVTWLLSGEVLHRDSLGSSQVVRPGQLNLMTAGRGIAHAEESVAGNDEALHGLQLWIALPPDARDGAPRFDHYADLPELVVDGSRVVVVLGEVAGLRSPATTFSPLVGAHIELGESPVVLPTDPGFEYGVLVVDGSVSVGGVLTHAGSLRYLPPGHQELRLAADGDATLFLVGGPPFETPLVMWWNFVGPDHESVAAARDDWAAGRRFGNVVGFDGAAMPAPTMPSVRLLARNRDGSSQG